MIDYKALKILTSVKNVVCPYCGYKLPIVYDKDTVVKNLLVTCKGRQCKESFVLNIKRGIQHGLPIPSNVIDDFKKVYGDDYEEHLKYVYGNYIHEEG